MEDLFLHGSQQNDTINHLASYGREDSQASQPYQIYDFMPNLNFKISSFQIA